MKLGSGKWETGNRKQAVTKGECGWLDWVDGKGGRGNDGSEVRLLGSEMVGGWVRTGSAWGVSGAKGVKTYLIVR